MALDSVVLNPGAGGDSIGTDNIGGIEYELVKQAFGDVGSLEVVSASNPLPVTDADAEASLSTLAGAVSGTEVQVDIITIPTVTVQATNLDIRDLAFASDKVDASGSVLGAGTNNIGDVDIASFPTSSTSTVTAVGDSASSVTLKAANASRKGLTIFNDSTAVLYIKLGAVASTSSYTFRAVQYAYYEVPFGYTGIVDGIWASDAGGQALVDELT